MSLPTRERELKHPRALSIVTAWLSLPTRERELKRLLVWRNANCTVSLPTRERELKLEDDGGERLRLCVAPYTGA